MDVNMANKQYDVNDVISTLNEVDKDSEIAKIQ